MFEKPLISFDYAIKYLLKDKGNYDIVEGFISALLAVQGYSPVKISALLESESNRESADLKRSIADLVVEDEAHNKYVVEIERSFTPHFMHKACFNSSRLVVDSLSGNQDYTTLKKVFHISLLYFSSQALEKPIYHGQTILHEIDTAHPVDFRIANQSLKFFEHRNIFPEYFFISIPLFNEMIHQEIDEWLYMMKHCEVRDDFKSPAMRQVKERLAVLKMSPAERNTYYAYLKEAVHSQDVLMAAEQKGEARGLETGRLEGRQAGLQEGHAEGHAEGMLVGQRTERLALIQQLKHKGLGVLEIAELTGLSEAEIQLLLS